MSTPLPRSNPQQEGVTPAGVRALRDALVEFGGVDSLMVVRHGRVIAEEWWPRAAPTVPHVLHSISKSFTAAAAGFIVDDGLLSLDDRVVDLLADHVSADHGESLEQITVRHLLTMTGGWGEETIPAADRQLTSSWASSILAKPIVHEPGTRFVYNSGSTYLVSAIVQKLTGERVVDFLRPRLFDPLGIGSSPWRESPEGVTTGGWGLFLTTEDIARFGLFCLGLGEFQGKRLLSEDWIREATAYQVPNANPDMGPDWSEGYGYQFWRCRFGAFRCDGANGQYCVMLPDQDAVVVITADLTDMQGELQLIWDHLLPAFDQA